MNLPPKILKQQIANKSVNGANHDLNTTVAIQPEPVETEQATKPTPMASKRSPVNPMIEKPAKNASINIQKTSESLPVLEAFQEFLDNERERNQKRLMVFSLSYLFAFLILILSGLFAGMIAVKKLKGDFLNIRNEVARLQTMSIKSRTDTDTLAQRLTVEASRLREEFESGKFMSDDDKTKFLQQISGNDTKLTKMDELVKSLQKENAFLKDNMAAMNARLITITNEVATSLVQIDNLRMRTEKNSAQAAASSERLSIVMSITPRGQKSDTEWRMPIPE
jgi:hypothetical protein